MGTGRYTRNGAMGINRICYQGVARRLTWSGNDSNCALRLSVCASSHDLKCNDRPTWQTLWRMKVAVMEVPFREKLLKNWI
jgi:hypothetical protein